MLNVLHLGGFGAVGRRLPFVLHRMTPASVAITVTCIDQPMVPPPDFDIPHAVEYNYIQLHERKARLNNVLTEFTLTGIENAGIQPQSLDLVVSTSGHWMPGHLPTKDATDEDLLNFTESYASLHASCVEPAVAALALAGKYLKPSGALVLTGAAAALDPVTDKTCGGMLTYGFNKAFTNTLAAYAGTRFNTVIFHPTTIDTEANRAAMPDADRSEWNDVDEMLEAVLKKATDGQKPEGVRSFKVETKEGRTRLVKA